MIKKIVIYLLSFILILFGLDWFYEKGMKESINLKTSYITKGNLKNDMLIVGPCESMFTINPHYLDSLTKMHSYNLSMRHADFADNYLHLYLYLKNNAAPKTILFYATPESFDLKFNYFHTYQFSPWYNDSLVQKVICEMDSSYAKFAFIPFMKYAWYNDKSNAEMISGWKLYLSDEEKPSFAEGYEKHENTMYHLRPDGYTAPQKILFADHFKVETKDDSSFYYQLYSNQQSFHWNKKREKYFREILKMCKEKGIKVFLYESPVYKGDVKSLPNRKELLQRTANIAHEYGIEYHLYDQTKIGLDKNKFVCPLITTVKGSKEFMDILVKDLLP